MHSVAFPPSGSREYFSGKVHREYEKALGVELRSGGGGLGEGVSRFLEGIYTTQGVD